MSSSSSKATKATERSGFIVVNRVSHARYLPSPASHAFIYPTLSIYADINALTNGQLSLGNGWLFGTGTRPWSRVTNIRPSAYLLDDGIQGKTLMERLQDFFRLRGMDCSWLKEGSAWLLTSPSYWGYEGINPLNVWFCYGKEHDLRIVLLEVHNTFGERHVYILQTGINEDASKPERMDHQWTIPRQFHVSPFNDRSGYYVCSISGSVHPAKLSPESRPLPTIRLNLLTTDKKLKLTAISRGVQCEPLTSSSLLFTLLRHPFVLFLSLLRIVYHATILHYSKRLDVFPRPEPLAADSSTEKKMISNRNPTQEIESTGLGVAWQKESSLDRISRERVDGFLQKRVEELGVDVTLVSATPLGAPLHYSPKAPCADDVKREQLTIWYRSPLFFTHLFILPSATHARLLGSDAERVFTVSDEALFLRIFEPPARTRGSMSQRLRNWWLPPNAPSIVSPPVHPLDVNANSAEPGFFKIDWEALITVIRYYLLERMERYAYSLFKARFVEGEEPWDGWGRLQNRKPRKVDVGSVRREV